MSSKERLGWDSFFEAQRNSIGLADLKVSRVVEEQRGLYHVAGEYDGAAEVSGRLRHLAAGPADYPAVGDWVALREGGIIDARFERRSLIVRKAAGTSFGEQVLCANVDTIFLVTALVGDLNPRRLERYLTMVWDAGAVPVVVLNKADACDDPDAACADVRARLGHVDVVAISALGGPTKVGRHDSNEGGRYDSSEGGRHDRGGARDSPEDVASGSPEGVASDFSRTPGVEALEPFLRPARTVALLGSSGVGKSTIVNRLLGRDALKTAAIREHDGRGRHTTTARQLVELPGGALLIDTPGMRELQLWTDEDGVAASFDDIAALAAECRFADCAHGGEPGCAVADAVETGALDPDRLEHYHRLRREVAYEERKHDKAAAAAHEKKWRAIHKANRAMYRERGR